MANVDFKKKPMTSAGLIVANLLIPVAVLIFASGFFPYKPFLSGLATFEEVETEEHGLGLLSGDSRPAPVFDKIIFMVVDALRSDFVYDHGSGFVFTQSLIRTGAAIPYTAHAAPPTVTMPRVKGLTSGSVPSFLDLILNFAESDTSSSLATQDTWLAQIKAHLHPGEKEGKLVFYGDDTWLKLFPDFFARTDGTSSFFVSDFTEVDNNVTRHLPHELNQPDWDAMIMHYLGLDHIGHKSGPLSPNMLPKQREMDEIVTSIYEAIDELPHLQNTLLVLAGDHGMNSAGNHGGSAAGETSPALVFISPKLRTVTCEADHTIRDGAVSERPTPPSSAAAIFAQEQKAKFSNVNIEAQENMDELARHVAKTWRSLKPADKAVYESLAFRDRMRYEDDQANHYCTTSVAYNAPAMPKAGTEFEYYRQVEQSDLVPTLAALLGVPVPRNNLGVIVPDMLKFWQSKQVDGRLSIVDQLLYRNALQILRILKATYGEATFDGMPDIGAGVNLAEHASACSDLPEGAEQLSCKWHLAKYALLSQNDGLRTEVLTEFLKSAQDTLSSTASSYNVSRLVLGTIVAIVATALALYSKTSLWPPTTAGVAFSAMTLLYSVMMFASSYVEEEQHFWYWTTSTWFICLYFTQNRKSILSVRFFTAVFLLLASHRLTTRWNQTGQKHAGADDVTHSFFPEHHIILWLLVCMTYLYLAVRIATRTFAGLASTQLSAMTALSITLPSLVFKLNFAQADSPEIVKGLAESIRDFTAEWNLVMQARATFVGLGAAVVAIVFLTFLRKRWLGTDDDDADHVSLPERLHTILTVFLITQTRVQNIPLFGLFELQRHLLHILLSPPPPTTDRNQSSRQPTTAALPTSLSIILLAHTSYFALGGSNAISSIDLSNAYNGVSGYNITAVGILLFASNWAGPVWFSTSAVILLQAQRDGGANEDPNTSKEKTRKAEEKKKMKALQKPDDGIDKRWIEEEHALLDRAAREGYGKPVVDPNVPGNNAQVTADVVDGTLWLDHLSNLTIFICGSLVAVMAACTVLRTHLFIWTVFSPKFLYAMAWAVGWHLIVNIGVAGPLWLLGRMGRV